MLELLQDVSNLVGILIVSIIDIIAGTFNLVIVDDPFWRGVELTLLTLVVWNNRKELISLIDRIPLLGGLVARGLKLAETCAEYVIKKLKNFWFLIRSKTWDRAVKFILETDKELRQ